MKKQKPVRSLTEEEVYVANSLRLMRTMQVSASINVSPPTLNKMSKGDFNVNRDIYKRTRDFIIETFKFDK